MKNLKLDQIIEKAIKHKGENKYYPTNIELKEEGTKYKCYEVSICHRDLLFFADKGTLNYVIDSYGDRNVLELYSID